MKRFAALLVCLLATGCATTRAPKQVQSPPPPPAYLPAAASALAFDSPVAPPFELAGLDRAARQPAAFLGYQDTVTEYFASGFEDHQTSDGYNDYYDRWSYSAKVGVRTR